MDVYKILQTRLMPQLYETKNQYLFVDLFAVRIEFSDAYISQLHFFVIYFRKHFSYK